MLRWVMICVILCAVTFGAVFALSNSMAFFAGPNSAQNGGQQRQPGDGGPVIDQGPAVAPNSGAPSERVQIKIFPANALAALHAPIVLPDASVNSANKQELPAEHEGRILFLGRLVKPEDIGKVPPDKLFTAELYYIAINVNPIYGPSKPGEPAPPAMAPKFVRWNLGDPLEAERVYVLSEKHSFRELTVGDRVEAGDIVAMINPILALDDLDIKKEKLRVALSEMRTSAATKDEAWNRYDSMVKAVAITPGAYSKEDIRGARLTHERYVQEEIAKAAAYVQAQRELNASITQLKQHEVRAAISGIVKTTYKSKGDAVKNFEPIMQIQDPDHLRIEGVMEVQIANKVKVGDAVYIEPAIAESPSQVLRGHLQEVTCVAVAKSDKPVIVSGSEDRTVRIWDKANGDQIAIIELRSAVRSLACTGRKAEANLALVGCADGSARLFDLDKIEQVAELVRSQKSSVTCVAFSPNGKMCATGHEDATIYLWDATNGNFLHAIQHAHKAPVTSVQFATDEQVVSAGRDGMLNLWKVQTDKAPVHEGYFDKRSGDVTQLGVSPDGKNVLFDDGKDLRILSLETKQMVGSIQNSGIGFRAMAMFAPDSKTILTTSASENRLQLWRKPALEKEAEGDDAMARRAAELREFTWTSGKQTSGAYSPDSTFIVTGTQDHQVLIWDMPNQEQIDKKLPARVTLVERSLDASSRQVRIWAELDNPGWLIPGGTASIVIPPPPVAKK